MLLGLIPDKNQSVEDLREQISGLRQELAGTNERLKQLDNDPEVVLYKWKSPARIFVPRSKKWFYTVAIIFLIIILVLAFLQELILILVLCALLMLIYVLTTIPPELVEHEITNKGIRSIDALYQWGDLTEFWLSTKQGFRIINIETKLGFPTRLVILLDPMQTKVQEQIIIEILKSRIIMKDFGDKAQSSFSKLTDGTVMRY